MKHPGDDLKSSGDPIADRRYGYGEMLRGAGDAVAAADLFAQTLELAPRWIAAWVALGDVRLGLGDREAAVAAWREALALDPADPLGVELKLAIHGLAPAPAAPPEGYVRALFDDYATGFEQALVGHLGYRAPMAIREAADAARPDGRYARVLDIGCGTGLTGEALRGVSGWLEGVDLSAGMVEQARAKRVFDALHVDEAVRFLVADGRNFDLIAAGDVAPYLGDLSALVGLAANALEPGGCFILTVEALAIDGAPGWVLQPSMRYAHSAAYLGRLAGEAGLALTGFRRLDLRLDRGEPVAGAVATLEKPGRTEVPGPVPAFLAQPPRRPRAWKMKPRKFSSTCAARIGVDPEGS